MFHSKFEDIQIEENSVDLLISSPPYGIGKSYETYKTIEEYKEWAIIIVKRISNLIREGGSVCWQVGNHIEANGNIFPLDILYVPLFLENKFELRNRLIWRVGHGLHSQKKLSGRYEVLLWFVKRGGNFTFNLDEVREPSIYPNKRAYKGKKKGELTGNPLGKNPSDVWEVLYSEWDSGIMDIPPEKTIHPCQFPVELAERCVLLFSNKGDFVIDPFAGVGSVLVACEFHERKYLGCEADKTFYEISCVRIEKAKNKLLQTRPIERKILISNEGNYPEEWKEILKDSNEKHRLVKTPMKEYAEKILK